MRIETLQGFVPVDERTVRLWRRVLPESIVKAGTRFGKLVGHIDEDQIYQEAVKILDFRE